MPGTTGGIAIFHLNSLPFEQTQQGQKRIANACNCDPFVAGVTPLG
jgi:hypothetical protein